MQLPLLALFPLAVSAVNIVSSNDDGWAEANIRALYDSLTADGHSVLLSAPADNQSGKGSMDDAPRNRDEACEYDSCPANSGPYGHNATDSHQNWVNSYPLTSMRYGIDTFSPVIFNGAPDLAVSGPNVGSNLGVTVFFSGTVGAASYAAHKAGIPALAFSGKSGDPTAWNASSSYPLTSQVYAQLATKVTDRVLKAGTPYLPEHVWLNVNFPEVSESKCSSAENFKFVLSRIFDPVPLVSGDDIEICGDDHLPSETDVVNTDGCYVSISVGNAEE